MTKQIIDSFWENFNMSRCKTAMLAISIVITLALAYTECAQVSSETLTMAFFVVIGYWTGRTTKGKDKNISFSDYRILLEKKGRISIIKK